MRLQGLCILICLHWMPRNYKVLVWFLSYFFRQHWRIKYLKYWERNCEVRSSLSICWFFFIVGCFLVELFLFLWQGRYRSLPCGAKQLSLLPDFEWQKFVWQRCCSLQSCTSLILELRNILLETERNSSWGEMKWIFKNHGYTLNFRSPRHFLTKARSCNTNLSNIPMH